jgi:hypothetical protein
MELFSRWPATSLWYDLDPHWDPPAVSSADLLDELVGARRARSIQQAARATTQPLVTYLTGRYSGGPDGVWPQGMNGTLSRISRALQLYVVSLHLEGVPTPGHGNLVERWGRPWESALQLCSAAESSEEMASFLAEFLPNWTGSVGELLEVAQELGLEGSTPQEVTDRRVRSGIAGMGGINTVEMTQPI